MRVLGSLPPSLLRGVAATAQSVVGALRAMDARRRLALLVAAGLIASLSAPWSSDTVTARGLSGPRQIADTFSGWQALSFAALVCAGVAVLLAAGLLVRSATVVEGLGARGRRAARARVDGGLVGVAGTLCAVVLLAALVDHPGPAVHGAGIHSASSVGWGVGLALGLGVVLVGLGLAMVRAVAAANRAEPARSISTSPSAPASASAEPPLPEFDFDFDVAGPRPPAPPVRRKPRRDRGVFSRTSR